MFIFIAGKRKENTIMVSADDSLQRLKNGNARFISNKSNRINKAAFKNLSNDQRPFAVILGCSDSRVPVEIIFDQGPGDLFVIRVAGNIAQSSQIGSIEYAVEQLGAKLVVVLGHSCCGAVLATMKNINKPNKNLSPNLHTIINHIRPGIEEVVDKKIPQNKLMQQAVRANINASIRKLQKNSEILKQRLLKEEIFIIGAEYSLETGEVNFMEI